MKAIDMHSHLSTEKGYLFKKPEEQAALERHYGMKVQYKSEEEMARDFREAGVKSILAGPFGETIDEKREYHTYVAQLAKDYPDAFIGSWVDMDPRMGGKGLRELERCIKDLGMTGLSFLGPLVGVPYNDKSCYPFYELCVEAKVPVLLYVGMLGLGARLPGGGGYELNYTHPIPYVDEVAAHFPDLTIIASHPAWPWQDEMIAVLLHKPNVYNDLHGWSPKYFSTELKREINGRLQDRFMFGADYPIFSFERLFQDWENESYKPEVLEKVFYKNAQRVLGIGL